MRYVAIILTIAVLAMGNLPGAYGQEIDRLGALPPGVNPDGGRNLRTAEVDLFDKRSETAKAIAKASPILAKAEGVVVVFGADWCTWCKRQAAHLKPHSVRYNMMVLEIDKPGSGRDVGVILGVCDKEGNPLASGVPITIVLEKGEPVETFIGFTTWDKIEPAAKKAKKKDGDQKGYINIGPIRIDWDLNGYDPDDDYNRHRRRR